MPALPVHAAVSSAPLRSVTGLELGRIGRSEPALPGIAVASASLEDLHPGLWRAHRFTQAGGAVWPSGFAALDAQLPGGGWPQGALSELLLAHAGVGELRLLAPVLAAVAASGKLLMLFRPPARLCAPALAGLGLAAHQCLIIDGPAMRAADLLWALELALKSGHAGAVLAWLPERFSGPGQGDALRRLQLAASLHAGPAFLLREWAAQQRPSPAPLRLSLKASGPDCLAVQVLKRRGPWHAQALLLELPPVLLPHERARAQAPRLKGVDAVPLDPVRPI